MLIGGRDLRRMSIYISSMRPPHTLIWQRARHVGAPVCLPRLPRDGRLDQRQEKGVDIVCVCCGPRAAHAPGHAADMITGGT